MTKTLVPFEIKDTEHTMKYNVKNTKKIIGVWLHMKHEQTRATWPSAYSKMLIISDTSIQHPEKMKFIIVNP